MRVAFLTLGCPKNEVDSDRMAAAVEASSFELVSAPDDADVVVLNTCAFITDAVEEAIDAIFELALGWRSEVPGRILIVAGCLPSRYGKDLVAELPEVDAFLPVAREHELLAFLETLGGVRAGASDTCGRTTPGPSAYLMVSDGCFRTCTYCTIPSIRGHYRSKPIAELVHEARALVGGGARELVLIGQDISSYGRDLDGHEELADVVSTIANVDGLEWLRLMYVQPDGISERLLEVMASTPSVCHYLDLPLQHSSRDVLRRMARSGDSETHLALIGRIRDALPDVVLRTSLIAGFPGETEGDLVELEGFLEAARLDYAGVFPYSPEEGTAAAELPDAVDAAERVERANRIRATADRIGVANAADKVGLALDVLVEGKDEEGTPVGRWRGQAPEVDGVVSLDVVAQPGGIVRARILDSLGYDLYGEVERDRCSR